MTIRSFWTIVLKILGLWLIFSALTTVSQFLSILFTGYYNMSVLEVVSILFFSSLTLIIYLFILFLFLFRTSWLINRLHLTKGFTEERIDLNIRQTAVLKIAIIVLGGLLFIDTLPALCKSVFSFFQQQITFNESPATGWTIFYFVKTCLGYLLMTNSSFIVRFISKNDPENVKQ